MSTSLSVTERQILELMWVSGKPLSRQEILKRTEGRSWNPSSIHLILNSMIGKNVLRITNEEMRYGRTYEAAITRDQYLSQLVDDAFPGAPAGKRLTEVVAALVRCDGIDEDTIDELETFLAQQRKQDTDSGN